MSGGGLDSRELEVRFLFSEVQTAQAFVQTGSILRDPEARARTIAFARQAHDTIVDGLARTSLTDEERDRLQDGVAQLAAAIRALEQR